MLKVVGASMHKTRISTYILIGALLLVIGAFFLAHMERTDQEPGMFCTTADYDERVGYHFNYLGERRDLSNIPKGLARICYKDSPDEDGWAQLELETFNTHSDDKQAYAAGYLEGYQTWYYILDYIDSINLNLCDVSSDTEHFCDWIRDMMNEKFMKIKTAIKNKHQVSAFEYQTYLYYVQLEGVMDGYEEGFARSNPNDEVEEIELGDLLLLNALPDLEYLVYYYKKFVRPNATLIDTNDQQSLMVLKFFKVPTSAGWKILFGKSATETSHGVPKIEKRYKLRYRSERRPSQVIQGTDVVFTSLPGVLASSDDFYIVKGRNVHNIISGVPTAENNLTKLGEGSLDNFCPLYVRSAVANRLSRRGLDWSKHMSNHRPSGSRQWLYVDLKVLNSITFTSDNIKIDGVLKLEEAVWISEQYDNKWVSKNIFNNSMDSNFTWVGDGEQFLTKSNVNHWDEMMTVEEDTQTQDLKEIFKFIRKSLPDAELDHVKLFSYDSVTEIRDFYIVEDLGSSDIEAKTTEVIGVEDVGVVEDNSEEIVRRNPKPVAFPVKSKSGGDISVVESPPATSAPLRQNWAWYDS